METKWPKVDVKDVCLGIYDGPHATPPPSKSGAIFLGIPNFVQGRLDLSDVRYISEEDLPKWTKRVTPRAHDVVFSYEATLNLYAIIPEGFRGCLGRRMALMRPNPELVDYRYLYYYMYSDAWRKEIERYKVNGSTVDRIPLVYFPDFQIELPDMETQRSIAAILGAVDEKIKVNKQINDNLEQQAQAIFHSWFVDLTPFGGTVPPDWRTTVLGKVCSCELGGTPSRAKPEFWNGEIPWINSGEVNLFRITRPSETITSLGLSKSATKLLPAKTTVIAITGATLGQVSLLEIDSCANQSVVGIIPNDNLPYEYIYPFIKQNIHELISHQTGGAQQHINKQNVEALSITIPSDAIIEQYREITTGLYAMIANNCFENEHLAEIRDSLLPKLMSGEIDVSAVEF